MSEKVSMNQNPSPSFSVIPFVNADLLAFPPDREMRHLLLIRRCDPVVFESCKDPSLEGTMPVSSSSALICRGCRAACHIDLPTSRRSCLVYPTVSPLPIFVLKIDLLLLNDLNPQ